MTEERNQFFDTLIRRIQNRTDVLLALAIVGILIFMIIPLPSFLLDILLAISITISLMILLVPIYAINPLEFSIFPGLLLMVTLFRLSLNVATTRLILGEAYAGEVVEAFGNFVVGGNYVVGLVIFIILVVINFVVITKGSGRIAEVAARFTLDAMPGKQMAIDADLNAGMIDESEARRRRDEIRKEADFYGAMDGASKFVRGDAIAGLLITAINIVGGLVIGMLQLNMSLSDALATYTILTVGDGLVSQIPALLVSTSAGIIVTKTRSEDNLAKTMTRQLLTKPRATYVSGSVLLGLGLVPGLPTVPFVILGLLMVGIGYVSQSVKAAKVVESPPPPPPAPVKEQIESYLHVDPLEVEIGYGLISMIDANQGGDLLDNLTMIRKQIAQELGIIVPPMRIRDNVQLNSNEYVIRMKGNEVGRSEVMKGYFLALVPDGEGDELEGIKTIDPTFQMPAYWVNQQQKEKAELKGYTVVDATAVISTHLMEVVKANAHKILDRQAVQRLLDNIKKENAAVVDELVPNLLSVGVVQNVLRNLLQEMIPIRDLSTILETLADRAPMTKDSDLLTEFVRVALAETITTMFKNESGELYVMTLDPKLEEHVLSQLSGGLSAQAGKHPGQNFNLPPLAVKKLFEQVAGKMQQLISTNGRAILLTGPRIRRYIRVFFASVYTNLVVLSYAELLPDVVINSVGSIGISNYD
ncbi:MAG TPA: flagellar biosynthesis protein FlhA [bacterium]